MSNQPIPQPEKRPGRCWVAVASAEHVAICRAGGFMQVGHGKGAPLKRLHAGDRVAYHSSVRVFGEKTICQAFTAVGAVRDDLVYQGEVKMVNPAAGEVGDDFKPFRKDVNWFKSQEASIRPLDGAGCAHRGRSRRGLPHAAGL